MSRNDKPTVLIVDDDINTVSMLNDNLDDAGFTVLVALEGAQALAITQQIIPNIILMDAVMPHLDGFETSRKMHQNPTLRHTPIIFMTGLCDTKDVVNAFDVGVVDYVVKPIRIEELLARMRTHLHNSQLTSSAYNALDSVGQLTCAFSARGQLLWATPHSWRLLEQCCDRAFTPDKDFVIRLLAWLSSAPNGAQPLALAHLSPALRIYLSRRTEKGEYLLRLEEMEQPDDETAILRKNFALTLRESEVMLWISRGKTNREIGQILALSPRTVNKHLEQIFRKLDVDNRTSAAALTLRVLN
ncbi:response regulator transcription factor [Affinibrenneria salicis]|uniref:Response regulator transcription factor n=1 Tax=Affinibrenneria salicis TaxID=2590031 RepID=A0A5J5FZ18_9GAMM|nr:DNA-binding response regulator [Affinibrenneria salicis]KAA8999422.1 response regulator transcription factor [Affinibrenneria salicis]